MKAHTISVYLKALRNPSRAVGLVRCSLDNFGDIMVYEAISAMLKSSVVLTYHWADDWTKGSVPERLLEQLVGLRRIFRYSGLGGGTLIFTAKSVGWLSTLQHVSKETIPVFTFGTGVVDPEFIEELSMVSEQVKPIDASSLEEWVECLTRFRFVGVRGIESKRTLRRYGFDRAEVVGDPALFFARETVSPKPRRKLIGINVSNYSYFWGNGQGAVITNFSNVIKWLKNDGWHIIMFPTMKEDVELIEKMREDLGIEEGDAYFRIHRNYSDIGEYLDALEKVDIFVGVKLHSVIAACCVYTPAIMVGYQPKGYDFMHTAALEDLYLRSDRVSEGDIIDRIVKVYHNLDSVQERQHAACEAQREHLLGFRDRVVAAMDDSWFLEP